jgi:hypothetical protein
MHCEAEMMHHARILASGLPPFHRPQYIICYVSVDGRTMHCTNDVAIAMASVIIIVISISVGTIIRTDIICVVTSVIVVIFHHYQEKDQLRLSQNS